MPQFRHRRTGKFVDVSDRDAPRFRNNRYEEVGASSGRAAVPAGTIAEILDWAGTDETRRAAALAAEKAGKNRKTLIDALS